MSFAGLSKPEDRANVIAYLKANGGGPEYPAPVVAEEPAAEGEGIEPVEAEGAEAAGAMAADEPVDTANTGATANP
jgi:cytochrome c